MKVKKKLPVVIFFTILGLLSACQPTNTDIREALEKTQAAQISPSPENSPTIAPTQTPDYTSIRTELAESIKTKTYEDVANINCHRVIWEDNILKLNCELVDWVVEPTEDHHFLHFNVFQNAIIPTLVDEEWDKYFDESSVIEIVSAGQVLQELSKTDYITLTELLDGTITTEIEWLSGAETIVN